LKRIALLLNSLLDDPRATVVFIAGVNMNEATTIAWTPRAIQAPNTDVLFLPYRLGPVNLRHRIVMAALTRVRGQEPDDVPRFLACDCAQRTSAALILSEAMQVSLQDQGYAWTPGLYSLERVEAWHWITQAAHQADGLIFNQIRHVGRISHPVLQARRLTLPSRGCTAAKLTLASPELEWS
jgi:N-ethylmaleimide reductase